MDSHILPDIIKLGGCKHATHNRETLLNLTGKRLILRKSAIKRKVGREVVELGCGIEVLRIFDVVLDIAGIPADSCLVIGSPVRQDILLYLLDPDTVSGVISSLQWQHFAIDDDNTVLFCCWLHQNVSLTPDLCEVLE